MGTDIQPSKSGPGIYRFLNQLGCGPTRGGRGVAGGSGGCDSFLVCLAHYFNMVPGEDATLTLLATSLKFNQFKTLLKNQRQSIRWRLSTSTACQCHTQGYNCV